MVRQCFFLFVLASVLTGCQALFLVDDDSSGSSHAPVMELWSTYKHCRAGSGHLAMVADARRLNEAAEHTMVTEPSPIPLPVLVMQHVIEPSPRFSVDPRAMVVSCSLYAGEAAYQAGDTDLAVEMFTLVLHTHPESDYGYYATEARKGLMKATSTIVVSQPSTFQVHPVSSSTAP